MAFALDTRLQNDTVFIGRNEHHLLLMMNDARYPWFIVVPEQDGVSEWFDLSPAAQQSLHADCVQLGQCVKQVFGCEKINIAALGNIVRQMHVHVIGRHQDDPAWPGPVWGHSPARPCDEAGKISRKSSILNAAGIPFR